MSRRLLLATVAGLLSGAGYIWTGPLVLFALVPLMAALHGETVWWRCALYGALTGFLGGLHIYGILDYGWFLWIGFALYIASQMALYGLLWRALWGRRRYLDPLLVALIWTLTEWLRTLGPLAMPASYAGCVADTAWLRPWLWLTPFVGGLGLSFLVSLFQGVVYHGLFHWRSHRGPALGALAFIALTGLVGGLTPPDLGAQEVKMIGVQGGLANHRYRAAEADPAAARDLIATYETLSKQAYLRGADLVVWPETAIRVPVYDHYELATRLFPPEGSRSTLIAGVRYDTREGSRNLASAIGPGGYVGDHYTKVRLVPGTEAYLTPGHSYTPLQTASGAVGVMICLESVHPGSARDQVRAGAELLVVMSNDAGFGRSPITDHMTRRATVRAVENGRWLMRVGQAGITTLIDPRGQSHGRMGLFVPGLLEGVARRRDDLTFSAAHPDWVMWLVVAGLLFAFSRRRSA